MTSVTEAKQKRQNRTVTLHLGNTLAEYQDMISTGEGIRELIRRVEIVDSLNWGCLAGGHKEGCPRRLQFTVESEPSNRSTSLRWMLESAASRRDPESPATRSEGSPGQLNLHSPTAGPPGFDRAPLSRC